MFIFLARDCYPKVGMSSPGASVSPERERSATSWCGQRVVITLVRV
jgi:hypothetical protein